LQEGFLWQACCQVKVSAKPYCVWRRTVGGVHIAYLVVLLQVPSEALTLLQSFLGCMASRQCLLYKLQRLLLYYSAYGMHGSL
jgi:hypothetical protein